MELVTEVINISKIKEGFYIGDAMAANNLDIIIKFKLTHMINAAGSEIINAWEAIGIKYLTLNWSDNSNQNLFDSKDEIANRIVFFVDDSFTKGEGLLAHSVYGRNRVCIVVIIYLMKKYKWTLNKCLEFLCSKKQDVTIPDHFLNQIILFESRLRSKGEETKEIPWTEGNIADPDEYLLRNTYVNGLPNIAMKDNNNQDKGNKKRKQLQWADSSNSSNKRNLIEQINPFRDLINQRDIKPITAHLMPMLKKSSLKGKSTSSASSLYDKPSMNLSQGGNVIKGFNNIGGSLTNVNTNQSNNTINKPNSNLEMMISNNESTGYNLSELLFDYSKVESSQKPSYTFNYTRANKDNNNTNINKSNPSQAATYINNNNNNTTTTKGIESNTAYINQVTKNNQEQLQYNNINTRLNHFSLDNNTQKRSSSYSSGDNANNKNKTLINQQFSPVNHLGHFNLIKDLSSNSSSESNDNVKISSNYLQREKVAPMMNNNNKYSYYPPTNFLTNIDSKAIVSTSNKVTSNAFPPSIATVNINISTNDNSDYKLKPVINNEIGKEKQPKMGNAANERPKPNKSNDNNSDYTVNNTKSYSGNDMSTNTAAFNNYIPNKKIKRDIRTPNNAPNQSKQIGLSSSAKPNQLRPLNNYNPNLNKKKSNSNMSSSGAGSALLDLSNQNSNKGPIKVRNNYTKPKTPDPSHSIVNTGLTSNKNNPIINNYGTFQTSKGNSELITRPATAPQKDKQDHNTVTRDINNNNTTTKTTVVYLNQNPYSNKVNSINLNSNTLTNQNYSNTLKRLPSPQLQSANSLIRSGKIDSTKYRAPSPLIKSSTLSLGVETRVLSNKPKMLKNN